MWSSFQCTIVIYLVMNAFINVCLIQGIETVNVKNSFSKQWNSGLQNSQSLEYWVPLFIVENWAEFIIFSEAAEHLGSVLDCKSGKPASSVARSILWFSSDNCSMSRCASDVLCGEVNSVSTNFPTLISFHRSNLLCLSTVNKLSEKEIKKKQFYPQYCQKQWNTSVSSVQSLSHVWLFTTPWTTARQASLSSGPYLESITMNKASGGE